MKKFRFRLQKVMEIKEEVEKQRMIDLSEAKQVVDLETTRLNHLNDEQIDCQHRIDEKSSTEKINPGELALYYRFLDQTRMRIEAQEDRLQAAHLEMERRRQILLEASKEKKVLEKLKEKKQAAYMIELNHKEQDMINEVASIGHYRKSVAGNQGGRS